MKILRNALLTLLVTLFALPAFAQLQQPTQAQQDQFENTVNEIIQSEADPENDLVLGWLQQTFGDVVFSAWGGGTSLTGVDATILTHAVGFSNVVALILGIVMMGYIVVAGAIHTAASGEVLGKNWSTVWLPLRISLALLLITPVIGAKGIISAVQAMIMTLIVVGSNAGTLLWEQVGKRITDGAPVTAIAPTTTPATVKTLFQSMVCAEWNFRVEGQFSEGANVVVGRIIKSEGSDQLIRGPIKSANYTIPNNATKVTFGEDGECGSISFKNPAKKGWLGIEDGSIQQDYHRLAVQNGMAAARQEFGITLNQLAKMADHLVNGVGGYGSIQNKIRNNENTLQAEYGQEINAYAGVIQRYATGFPEAVTNATTRDAQVADLWRKEVAAGGWGAAGRWFFEISRFQQLNHSVITSVVSSVGQPKSPNYCGFMGKIASFFSNCEKYTEQAGADMNDAVSMFHSAAVSQLAKAGGNDAGTVMAVRALAEVDAAMEQDPSTLSSGLSAALAAKTLGAVAAVGEYSTDGMNGKVGVTDASSIADPFRTVTSIGEGINDIAILAWALVGTAEVAGGTADMLYGGGPLKGLLRWIATTLTSLVGVLIPMGFILAFLIPFLPIITWIRLLVAYLLTAVEAVIAGPLAVVMMVTPEGEGIAGTRMERAIQLLAAVILKPTLLVIGLVASITLAYVSFGIVNLLFWKVAFSVTDTLGIFEIVAILVIYTSLAFQVAKGSILIMQKLPDQILDWMAGGAGGRSFGDDAEHGVSSSMSETKSSLGGVSSTLSRSVEKQGRHRRKAKEETPAGDES